MLDSESAGARLRDHAAMELRVALHPRTCGPTLEKMSAGAQVAQKASGLPWRRPLENSGRLVVVLLAAVFVVTAALLGGMTWRTLRRLQHIETRVESIDRIQSIAFDLENLVLDALASETPIEPTRLQAIRARLQAAGVAPSFLLPDTAEQLDHIRSMLDLEQPVRPRRLLDTVEIFGQTVDLETKAQSQMLAAVRVDTRREFGVAVGMLAVLAALGLSSYWVLQRQVVRPLHELHGLLSELANGNFNALVDENAHPILQPLLRNYNYLVMRLAELEEQHRSRAETLESEVRAATEALLEQHRSLARAERLAAVGELTAGLAHEMRNPLAGILMGLGNLRGELHDGALVERLDLLTGEIQRLVRLLNAHLLVAHGQPEVLRRVELAAMVRDLLTLVRYQTPSPVKLAAAVPDDISCMLPRDRVRQALLNLILNSIQAVGAVAGRIEVGARRDADTVELWVSDSGPGFPAELLVNGVRPYATSRESGTGLGLPMVRRVAVDLGGELQLSNRNGSGACARMILPYHPQ